MIAPIAAEADVERLLGLPRAWLMKHSQTCSISLAALAEVDDWLAAHPDAPAGKVVVQTHRPVSNWIATRLGFAHQSPQLFLLRRGKVAWQASHWGITGAAMEAAWNAAAGD